ncbi:hypothetical protein ABK040_006451 [Willaertia magna]
MNNIKERLRKKMKEAKKPNSSKHSDEDIMEDEERTEEKKNNMSIEENIEIGKELKLSRIIVKGLPAHLSIPQFKKIFEEYGQVTDCKIMKTKSGKSRCFGYIGYKSHESTLNAVQERNQTFINMAKITVEFALPYNDPRIARPWSKHSRIKQMIDEKIKLEREEEKKKKQVKPEEVDEFLNIGKKKSSNVKFWDNDLNLDEDEKKEDDEELQTTTSNNELKDSKKIKFSDNNKASGNSSISNNNLDSSILQQREMYNQFIDDENEEDTGRLFVYNLHYTVTEDEIRELFEPYGQITEIEVPTDSETKQARGIAFILFLLPESAEKARKAINNTIFQGRLIHVTKSKEKPTFYKEKENLFFAKSSFKREQLKKKREQAQNTNNWNATYMSSDTVAESMSRQIGVSKSELLLNNKDYSGLDDNAAVRLALAETELIKQTKEELQEFGINLDVLNNITSQTKLSRNIILVKNIPFEEDTEKLKQELYDLFGKNKRRIAKVVIPSTKTLAIIEFYEPSEARQAFSQLAYKNFHHIPLYLQWAPEGIIINKKKVEKKKEDGPVRVTAVEDDNPESTVLFVKNINFNTTDEKFEEVFKKYNPRSAKIVHANGKSKGFGFVEFSNLKEAVKAHDELQNVELDNHVLVIQYSSVTSDTKTTTQPKLKKDDVVYKDDDKGVTVTFKKLIVRNVAFEATRQDLYQLFSAYGQVQNIRLPKKVGSNSHRGFAFIEFSSPKECYQAYQALKHSHLYGRTLKLEFSHDVSLDNIKEMQEKSKEDFEEKNTKKKKGPGSKRKRDAFV